MTLNTISEANQDRLVSALDSAMTHYNAGNTPSGSVAKAASAVGFNANYTKRLSDMFNASLTLDHLGENRFDGDKRASSFPLADFTEVWSLMKQPAQEQRKAASIAIADHTDSLVPSPVFDWGLSKSAAVAGTAPVEDEPVDDGSLTAKIAHEKWERNQRIREANELDAKREKAARDRNTGIVTRKAAVDRSRLNYYGTKEKMASALEFVVNKLRRTDSCDWNTFKAAAANAYPGNDHLLDHMEPKVITNRGSLKAAAEMGLQSGTYVNRDFKKVAEALDAYGKLVGSAKIASEALGIYKKAESDLTAWMTSSMPKTVMESMAPEFPEVRPTNFFKRLAALEGYANLAKLMTTDPVIGSADNDKKSVKRLYKEITKVNPAIAQQPIALRGFLRRGLESSPDSWGKTLDTYDIKQLADTDLGDSGKGWGTPSPVKKAAEKTDEKPDYARSAGMGALGGAGAGLLYSLVGGQLGDDWKDHLRRTATGAVAGAGLGAGTAALKPRGVSNRTGGLKNESPVARTRQSGWDTLEKSFPTLAGVAATSGLSKLFHTKVPKEKGSQTIMPKALAPLGLAVPAEFVNQRLLGGSSLGSDVIALGTGGLIGSQGFLHTNEPLMKVLNGVGRVADKVPQKILSMTQGTRMPGGQLMRKALEKSRSFVKGRGGPTVAAAMTALLASRLMRKASE